METAVSDSHSRGSQWVDGGLGAPSDRSSSGCRPISVASRRLDLNRISWGLSLLFACASESALVKSPAGAPVYQGTLEEAQFRKVTEDTDTNITCIHIYIYIYMYIYIERARYVMKPS
jgi:hypothetical protein